MILENVNYPQDLKKLNIHELNILSNEIREYIIKNVSLTGGHLSSNLGVVELTIALHYVFDAPNDKFIFDVGHQCYTHKILTGRKDKFSTLRQYNGISGFQKKAESVYDCWEAGHSSTSLSAALGMCIERDLNNDSYKIVSIIGDGSVSNGMAFEALNHIGELKKDVIIILNDNGMSISKNHGAFNNILTKLRISDSYLEFKNSFNKLDKKHKEFIRFTDKLRRFRDKLKAKLVRNNMFKEFNIDYLGPIDGHDMDELINAFTAGKKHHSGPILVHVITKKGKGYLPCEKDSEGNWHGVSKFNIETGKIYKDDKISYSSFVGEKLNEIASKDDKVVVITPAMKNGSGLTKFELNYPDRFFDVGISEEHGATFAAGIANNKQFKPYYVIYSTFVQRCYDQINHDIARMNLPVRILLDRAGIVGADGPTHHGVFDIALFNSLPNMTICQASCYEELGKLIDFSLNFDKPLVIRYPRGGFKKEDSYLSTNNIELGKWDMYKTSKLKPDFIVITYGDDVNTVYKELVYTNLNGILVNAKFIKPIDESMLKSLFNKELPIFVFTADAIKGGLGDSILEFKNNIRNFSFMKVYGISDHFLPQGNNELLRKDEGCDIESLIKDIKKICA